MRTFLKPFLMLNLFLSRDRESSALVFDEGVSYSGKNINRGWTTLKVGFVGCYF